MYIDKYLKFTDEPQSQSVLYTEVPTKWDEDGNVLETEPRANYQNIDTIGVIYQPQEDPEAEPVAYDGFFVNIRLVAGEDAAALEPFSIDPKPFPMRVWA